MANPDFNDGDYEVYRVVMEPTEDSQPMYMPGALWEMDDWTEEGYMPYDVQVARWYISAFDMEMRSRPDVVSWVKM